VARCGTGCVLPLASPTLSEPGLWFGLGCPTAVPFQLRDGSVCCCAVCRTCAKYWGWGAKHWHVCHSVCRGGLSMAGACAWFSIAYSHLLFSLCRGSVDLPSCGWCAFPTTVNQSSCHWNARSASTM
jgi:hypothetical protein